MNRMTILAAAIVLTTAGAASSADIPAGAAACSGCHPAGRTTDALVTGLAGRNPAEITGAMLAFRAGQRPDTVMGRIAKGFTDDEIKAIAAWWGAQKN